jgi:hypothetical protein
MDYLLSRENTMPTNLTSIPINLSLENLCQARSEVLD